MLGALGVLAALGTLAAAGAAAGAPLAGTLAAAFDRDRRLLVLMPLSVVALLSALLPLARLLLVLLVLWPLLLRSMPPCPRHAPRPPWAEVVPSLHGTLVELLALAELGCAMPVPGVSASPAAAASATTKAHLTLPIMTALRIASGNC